MSKRRAPICCWHLLAFFLVLCDQEVKLWVRTNLALGERRPFLPHLVELLHVENTGAAFSLFNEHTWVLAAASAIVAAVLAVALWRDWFSNDGFSRLCVTPTLAGAVGNLIDRVAFGAVTDMFNFTFMTFGVFNVADICVVVGCVGYCGYLLIAPRLGRRGEDPAEGGSDDADAGV